MSLQYLVKLEMLIAQVQCYQLLLVSLRVSSVFAPHPINAITYPNPKYKSKPDPILNPDPNADPNADPNSNPKHRCGSVHKGKEFY